jgi:SAM-dependent methyltransferase
MESAVCRVCRRPGLLRPLVRFEGMPAAAQGMPGAEELAADTGVELELLHCPACGVAQLAGAPVPYYRDVIRAARVSGELLSDKQGHLATFVGQHDLQGKCVLEVGCGRGEFLELLPPLGVAAAGMEHSEGAVEECVARGLDVMRGYPGDGELTAAGRRFDAFLLFMFLEHMPDPGAALLELRGSLVPGAPGIVEVPNFDMVTRAGMFAELIADHLLYFTAASLRTTLELNGFSVGSVVESRGGYVLTAAVHNRVAPDLSDFDARRASLQHELRSFISRFSAGRIAVWGAGHQAFALIALTGIAGDIRYVVDSAPFKQGRYTPATHLSIVAPDTLLEDPVDAVIVIAGSYSDEVTRVVRELCGERLEIAVVREDGLRPG